MTERGGTLVELVVAMVVFQLGLLGVAGTLVLSARLATRVSVLERGAVELEWSLDSLHRAGWTGPGGRPAPGGTLSWWSEADGTVWVEFTGERGTPVRMWTSLEAVGR